MKVGTKIMKLLSLKNLNNRVLIIIFLILSLLINLLFFLHYLRLKDVFSAFDISDIIGSIISGFFIFYVTFTITNNRTQEMIELEREHNRAITIENRKIRITMPIYEIIAKKNVEAKVLSVNPRNIHITDIPERIQDIVLTIRSNLLLIKDIMSEHDYMIISSYFVHDYLKEAEDKYIYSSNNTYYLKKSVNSNDYKDYIKQSTDKFERQMTHTLDVVTNFMFNNIGLNDKN